MLNELKSKPTLLQTVKFSGHYSLSTNYSAFIFTGSPFPEPPSEPGADEWYQFHFPVCSLANIVAEIGEFSHFELHSNLKANWSFLYHALMQCFFSKTFLGLARTIKSRYQFQWQYLGADLQPLWVEKDHCYLGCLLGFVRIELVSMHHVYPQKEIERCSMHTAYTLHAFATEYVEHAAVMLQNWITEQQ